MYDFFFFFNSENVQKEIEQIIGLRRPQIEHRKQMPYTDAVVHEIQRFGNIVPAVAPHATTQDMMFRGYFLPKGTEVLLSLSSVLKDKKYFEKPDEFYPEHFLDSHGHFVKNEAFLPFSAGIVGKKIHWQTLLLGPCLHCACRMRM
ncbi:hypothetical protein GDO78_017515 [Eleutherodactylus coqui]|uniref:Uncharacterized protein n=1 Tax=Eleutherodactylus coqui TaxID=57060 RepID=A0A8J6E819_ELECQ|nr:hypothetical protein GDO78_017515 [Eleutherodactylus coqui]